MTKRLIVGCVAVLAFLATLAAPQPAVDAGTLPPQPAITSRISPPPDGHRFAHGVTYYYKAEWRFWDAGEASLRIERNAAGMEHIVATANSSGFVGKLFRVADQFESAFDPRTFCSAYVSKRTEEGRRKRDVQIRFDYARRKSVFEDTNLRSGEKKKQESDIPPCVTDVLSGLYYAASLPLEPGQTHAFPINDGSTVEMKARVEEREKIKTEVGTFNTVRIQPDAPIGPLKSKGKVWIWYSDDAERIPVQVRGRMFWGTLTLRLTRIEPPQAASNQAHK